MGAPDDFEPSVMGRRVIEADEEALLSMWAFGMDITNIRPGEFARHLERTYDAMVEGMGGGSRPESKPDAGGENGP